MISEKEYKLLSAAIGNIGDFLHSLERNEISSASYYIGKVCAKIEEVIRDYKDGEPEE
jgi:hypothetical protein